MLSIFVELNHLIEVKEAIDSENRLNELIDIQTVDNDFCDFLITENEIHANIDWSENLPPILLNNPLNFDSSTLLSLIFLKLGNWEKVYEYCSKDKKYLDDLDLINRLQANLLVEIPAEPINEFGTFDHYRRWHNRAVVLHRGNTHENVEGHLTRTAYEKSLLNAPNSDYRAFSGKYFVTFLLDNGLIVEAEQVLKKCISDVSETHIKAELQSILNNFLKNDGIDIVKD